MSERTEQLKIEEVERSAPIDLKSLRTTFARIPTSAFALSARSVCTAPWNDLFENKTSRLSTRDDFTTYLMAVSGICLAGAQEGEFTGISFKSRDDSLGEDNSPVAFNSSSFSVEGERLKSQLIASRRVTLAARKTAMHLSKENERLREINDALQSACSIHSDVAVCLHESHDGVVGEVLSDQVLVIYNTLEGPLKQIYSKNQFISGTFPKEGDKIEAHILIGVVDRRNEPIPETEFLSDLPTFGDKAEPGPITL